jgi:hypothetical protein
MPRVTLQGRILTRDSLMSHPWKCYSDDVDGATLDSGLGRLDTPNMSHTTSQTVDSMRDWEIRLVPHTHAVVANGLPNKCWSDNCR